MSYIPTVGHEILGGTSDIIRSEVLYVLRLVLDTIISKTIVLYLNSIASYVTTSDQKTSTLFEFLRILGVWNIL